MRYFIQFAYNGTHYHGWQYQPSAISVQETLNKVFSTLLNQEIDIMGAGRTDTGVHASKMFGHFDTNVVIDNAKFIHKANSFLPNDIVIYDIIPVHENAHARFDATSRTYQYHISTFKNAFNSEINWYTPKNLDIEKMNDAAKLLLNFNDFQCFSKVNTDVNTFNCKITEAFWTKEKESLIFTISADRFLRNMVRAIVGTLVNVGLHKITIQDFIQIIESKNRQNAGFSVPAKGLFLTQIDYPYIK
ncbi:tRNA pseudouridine(38-40) synthase TruA [Flavobacterium sp.]|uniref:tRNA pseudouridine(38-40) synthase TruA n=1 Tax=Flavobacterium sp. TaxID=239 RepID=UPI00286CC2D4|nr:tRNA pseudouridine(38-40) synthase TruA [Flavobacterium sp.]